jgi:hypothetical protein
METVPASADSPLNAVHVRHAERGAEVEPGKLELGVRSIVAAELSLSVQVSAACSNCVVASVFEQRPRGMRGSLEAPNRCPPKVSAVTLRGPQVRDRRASRSAVMSKRELAGKCELIASPRANHAKARDVDVLGARVHLEAFWLEVITSRRGEVAAAALSVADLSLSTWPASAPWTRRPVTGSP